MMRISSYAINLPGRITGRAVGASSARFDCKETSRSQGESALFVRERNDTMITGTRAGIAAIVLSASLAMGASPLLAYATSSEDIDRNAFSDPAGLCAEEPFEATESAAVISVEVNPAGTSSLRVSWDDPSSSVRYEVLRSAFDENNFEVIADIPADDQVESYLFDDESIELGIPYYYRVVPFSDSPDGPIEGTPSASSVGVYRTPAMRLAALDRYGTSAHIAGMYRANALLDGMMVDTVVVCSGENYPDALAASALCGVLDAPVLLTNPGHVEDATMNQLISIAPSQILIVGGDVAVSKVVEDEIRFVFPDASVSRLAGSSRVKTAEKIYEHGLGDWSDTCIIATGNGYADALSISPYAYASKSPLFLTQTDGSIAPSTRDAIERGGFNRAIVIGGNAAVPLSVEKQLGRLGLVCERWSGDDRFATSCCIAEHAVSEGTLSWDGAGFARGDGFADALSGGALQGRGGSAMLLVTDSDAGRTAFSRCVANSADDIGCYTVFGGPASVSDALFDEIGRACGI